MTLEQERRELDQQRRELERDKQEFSRRVEIADRRLEQQQKLFDMKVKILEEELQKLASEKVHMERQREFYNRVSEFEQNSRIQSHEVVRGELFFSGVESKQSLKKRYKDLIKIYHPDNVDGDNDTVLEINREYDHLIRVFG